MNRTQGGPIPAPTVVRWARPHPWRRPLRRLRRDGLARVGLVMLFAVLCASLVAPLVGQALGLDPTTLNLQARLESPSARHWLGTDEVGRDVFIRLLYAGRVSLLIGAVATIMALALGISLGVLSGFYRGWVDDTSNALIQLTLNIPSLMLLILLSVVFDPSVLALAVILGLLSWQGTARQVRASIMSLSHAEYAVAARAIGVRDRGLMVAHLLPNVVPLMVVIAGFDVAHAILAEAALSALGLGVQPPTASWGNMLSKSFQYALKAPWLVVSPGVMIFVTVLSVFLIADGLRDSLDPRLN